MALVELVHFSCLSDHLLILELERFLQSLGSLHLLAEFNLSLVPNLVGGVKLAHGVS